MNYSEGAIERFWSKVDKRKQDDCWVWLAGRTPDSYGRFYLEGRNRSAHRVVWEIYNGAIPEGIQIDHICHTRPCVNPAHLRMVTGRENSQNRAGAAKNSASGVRGVTWVASRGRWRAQIIRDGKAHWGGYHLSLAEASVAAMELRRALFTHDSDALQHKEEA